jgi:rhamnose transport system ATP-binding protein
MNAVELVRLSKSFPGVRALDDVDLTLHPGTIHALVGENGAGKSTLINLLSGLLHPNAGQIRIAGRPVSLRDARDARRQGIVTVHQEADLFPDLSVMENVGLEVGLPRRLGVIDWPEQRRRTRAALETVGEAIPPGLPAGALTPAQRQLVEIAAAVSHEARVLILDEPTSSLSEAEARVLFGHLRRFRAHGTSIVYVSHRLEEVFALADEVTVLRDGRRVHTGPLADLTRDDLIRLMVGREVVLASPPSPGERGPVLLDCRGLTAADGSFRDVSLQAHSGEVLGLYGLIGAGRTEWAQATFGLRPLAAGEIHLNGSPVRPRSPAAMARAGLAYVPEDRLRQGLCRGLSVRANAVLASLRRLATLGWLPPGRETHQARETVHQLQVRYHSLDQAVGTLSGGNQQKVVLGRWLACEPAVLILDEPTRGVDVGAKAEIHALIRRQAEAGRAVVLISSELPEVVGHSDRVAVFREGRLVAEFDPRTASHETIAAAALPVHTPTVAHTSGSETPTVARASASWVLLLRELSLLGVVLVFFLLMQLATGDFLGPANLRELLTEATLLSFCAVGAGIVLLAGGLDISLGALMALSAAVAGKLWEAGQPFPAVLAVALAVGAAGGAANAGLSLLGRVHPIVITLGTMTLYRGLTLWWLGEDVQVAGDQRNWLFAGLWLPLVTWAGLLFLALSWLGLNYTLPGRECYALGSNPSAAHRVGIRRRRVWLGAFTIQGALAGLAGLLYLARSGGLQSTSYGDKTLQAIAAAVVGGVAITGGRGSVWGVFLGCLLLVSLHPACIALGIHPTWQQTLVGSVLALAVLADTLGRGRAGQ